MINYMLNEKAMGIPFTVRFIKKYIVLMSEYFPELKYAGGTVNVELNKPDYLPKADFKNAAGFDRLMLRSKIMKIKYQILLM